MQLVSRDLIVPQKLEYIVLYFAPIPLLLFCYEINKKIKIAKEIVIGWLTVYIIFNIVAHICQIANIWHFPVFLPIYHILMIIGILTVVGILVYDFYIGKNIESQTKIEVLRNLAYRDVLTGIYNRTKMEKEFEKLSSGHIPYYVVYFDLNGLKTVNDSKGHEKGDQLIKIFADILNDVFSGDGVVGRMGGDEFVVILRGARKKEVVHLIENMKDEIAKKNLHLDDLQLDTSYGIASSTELRTFNWEIICAAADEHMYQMKNQKKGNA